MQSGGRKRFWIGLGSGIALGVILFTLIIWPIIHAGTIRVEVSERDGVEFSLAVPVFVLTTGVSLIPQAIADEISSEIDPEIQQCWDIAHAACESLERSPDFVLVSVESHDEFVFIEKKGRNLIVNVDSDGDEVRVVLPLKAVGTLLDKLECRI